MMFSGVLWRLPCFTAYRREPHCVSVGNLSLRRDQNALQAPLGPKGVVSGLGFGLQLSVNATAKLLQCRPRWILVARRTADFSAIGVRHSDFIRSEGGKGGPQLLRHQLFFLCFYLIAGRWLKDDYFSFIHLSKISDRIIGHGSQQIMCHSLSVTMESQRDFSCRRWWNLPSETR